MSRFAEGTAASEPVSHYADSIKGKIILTTGVTPGSIGAAYVEAVAAFSPGLLILAGRSEAKLDKELETIRSKHPNVPARKLIVDLASLESVRKAAAEVNSWDDAQHIDVVMNCAGIMAHPFGLSPDGVEMHFAANHLGHFLLTNLIMNKILASQTPRVIIVSSDGHRLGQVRLDDINFDGGKTYNRWFAYGQSKTANNLMAISLAQKLGSRGLLAYSLHPGLIIGSNLATHLDLSDMEKGDFATLLQADRDLGNAVGWAKNFGAIMPLNSDQGAACSVYASFDPELEKQNGKYLLKMRVGDPFVDTLKPWATNRVEAEKLWRLSEELVGQKFSY